MTVTWTLELNCLSCGAKIVYESEIPYIRHDRNSIIANNRAIKFMKDHPVYEENLDIPGNVIVCLLSWDKRAYQLNLLPTKYTLCPVCRERIYFE